MRPNYQEINVLFSSRAFLLSTPTFLLSAPNFQLSAPMDNSENTCKKATKGNKIKLLKTSSKRSPQHESRYPNLEINITK